MWGHSPRHYGDECEVCNYYSEDVSVKMPAVTTQADGGQTVARLEAPKLLAKLPTVVEVLVQPSWEGGEGKGERAVFAFVSGTLVKLLLKIESPPLKLMVQGRSWDEAWAALEATLRSQDIPWEQDTPRQQQGRKKKA